VKEQAKAEAKEAKEAAVRAKQAAKVQAAKLKAAAAKATAAAKAAKAARTKGKACRDKGKVDDGVEEEEGKVVEDVVEEEEKAAVAVAVAVKVEPPMCPPCESSASPPVSITSTTPSIRAAEVPVRPRGQTLVVLPTVAIRQWQVYSIPPFNTIHQSVDGTSSHPPRPLFPR
jgi:hypothetical protein